LIFGKVIALPSELHCWCKYQINRTFTQFYLFGNAQPLTGPFYNGFALVTQYDNQKIIIDEKGNKVLVIG